MTTSQLKGFRFTHLNKLDPYWKPDLSKGEKYATDCPKAHMAVTRVVKGTVYFAYVKPDGSLPTRGLWTMDINTFAERYTP